MSKRSGGFFDVPQGERATSEGNLLLPAFYFDASNLLAFFLADREAATDHLEDTGLRPALTIGRRVLAALAFYEYRRSTVGTYNEVGLGLPVLPEAAAAPRNPIRALYGSVDKRAAGMRVLDLPVTTSLACAGGRELWGFPKFVTDISFHLASKSFESSVLDPNDQTSILSLAGRLSPGVPAPPMSLVLYSTLDGDLLRATVNVRGRVTLRPGLGLKLTVGDSNHRMARNLRALGLDGAHPIAVMETHRFQSRLNAGVPVANQVTGPKSDRSAKEDAGVRTEHPTVT